MTTRRSKSPEPIEPIKVRSTVARQAWARTSAGAMDSRPRRQRDRSAARRWAVADAS